MTEAEAAVLATGCEHNCLQLRMVGARIKEGLMVKAGEATEPLTGKGEKVTRPQKLKSI